MKATGTFILSAILASLVAAAPAVDHPPATPARSPNAAQPANLFKRDCNGGSCPCNLPDYSFCINNQAQPDSCFCQSACCSANNGYCWPADQPHLPGDYCFGGTPGK
ncbi:hypothetical protein QBC47DRAFT_404020 [Echria macrotheca]|uniref:Uncharacterized protein n=1 Tax=Echria macrotheca TaxID=438768 RepID=A0AAJ0F9Z6_9PEZI|nr:hypothetical protein QBC47DRAFT_404020 [Echria macrotheca]